MFKKLKNFIVESYQEGVEEGKAELAQENEIFIQQQILDAQTISELSYNEKFAASLAAPFRESIFLDWFTLFKSSQAELEAKVLLHLFSFGKTAQLTQENLKEIKAQVKDSFDFDDETSALEILKDILSIINIELESLNNVNDSNRFKLIIENDFDALAIAMCSIILVSSVDLNYIAKDKVLTIFEELIPYVKKRFTSWNEYGTKFLEQEKLVRFNKGFSRKQLEKDIDHLINKNNSPWQHVEW